MAQPVHPVHFTLPDYFAFERSSNVKHENLAGQIYAMAGGTPEHAALAAAVSGNLFLQLKDGPCRLYSSDLRVRAGDLITYPDVAVVCGPVQRHVDDANTALNPKLLVEVTSPSTEEYDRGEKLGYYQQIGALDIVLVVSHREASIDVWRRTVRGFERSVGGAGSRIELVPIGCTLSVDDVYRGIIP
jgi:Uma2 family endonuclease